MNYEVLFRTEAEIDLLDAVVYYEEKLKGLGNEFIKYFESVLEIISNQPESFPIVYKNVRRALLRKFPFGVHYIIEENKIIVIAIFHFSRDPKNWKSRTQ